MYTIGQFAKLINVTTQTLRNWDKKNILVPIKTKTNQRRYTDQHLMKFKQLKVTQKLNVIYCRQSTKNQKNSLENQQQKLKQFCLSKGIEINKIISQFGSALNYNRAGLKQLIQLIITDKVQTIVIYYKDRLVRFGFQIIQYLCSLHGVTLIIADTSQTNKTKQQQFADDLISIIHYFSMKVYGSRNYKSKIKNTEQQINSIKKQLI